MVWLGLRQLVATVLLSIAGLQPGDAIAAEAPRYEVEFTLRVDNKNQSLSAETLRLLEVRAHATAAIGSRGLTIVGWGDTVETQNYHLLVRGTTVPKLLERLIAARTVCGWSRDAGADAGKSRPRRTAYEEAGPASFARWGAADPAAAYYEVESDERSVLAASLGRDGADDVLVLSLEEPGPDHRQLIVAGMVVPEDEVQGKPLVEIAVPQEAEEQAAIIGLIRLAPQTLSQPVVVLDARISQLSSEGTPATVTRRADSARTATPDQLEALLKDPSPLVRRRAVLSGIERGPKGRRVLEHAVTDPDPMVSAPAASALVAAGVKLPEGVLWRLAAARSYDCAKAGLEGLMRDGPDGQRAALQAFRDERRLAAALPEIAKTRFKVALSHVERLAGRSRIPAAVRTEAAQTAKVLGSGK